VDREDEGAVMMHLNARLSHRELTDARKTLNEYYAKVNPALTFTLRSELLMQSTTSLKKSSRLAVARALMKFHFKPWFEKLENSKNPGYPTALQVIEPLCGEQGLLTRLEKTLTDAITRDVSTLADASRHRPRTRRMCCPACGYLNHRIREAWIFRSHERPVEYSVYQSQHGHPGQPVKMRA
jgi:hypothetical protein